MVEPFDGEKILTKVNSEFTLKLVSTIVQIISDIHQQLMKEENGYWYHSRTYRKSYSHIEIGDLNILKLQVPCKQKNWQKFGPRPEHYAQEAVQQRHQ